MTEIPVYSKEGQVDYILELPEDVQHVSGRTSKGEKLYYKGVGSQYLGHSSVNPNGYNKLGEHSVFYYGWNVLNPAWEDKFGIFQDKFQPYFSDYIGTCGSKELNIIFKSRRFELSAVDVVDAVEHDPVNNQYYFVLDYKSPRNKYDGNSRALIHLLSYMVQAGWCFPWDKTSINDINNQGCVTDVADMFQSDETIHAFGTVYSVLYSLFKIDNDNYNNLLKSLNCSHNSISDIPLVAMLFLRNCGKDIYIKQNISSQNQLYVHLVGNVLLRGRNCAGVENIDMSDAVMIQYLDRFKETLSDNESSVLEVY